MSQDVLATGGGDGNECVRPPSSAQCLYFLITDDFGDGLRSSDDPDGYYRLSFGGEEIYYSTGEFEWFEQIEFCYDVNSLSG